MKPSRINSLSGLRAVAMLTVFCSHLSYLAETSFSGLYSWISNGRFGVNFFLVLSGFMLALGYSNKLNARSISGDYIFVNKRIARIYIPYIITMLLAIPWYIYWVTSEEGSIIVHLLISRLLINIGMLQSVIPFEKYSISFNDVSWFISTIFFIYLFTPGIIRLNNKVAKSYTLLKLIFLVFAVLGCYCGVYMLIRQIEYVSFADRGLSIIYRSPIIRLFPFLIGIVAYNCYCHCGDLRVKEGSFAETLGIAAFFVWWIMADKTGLPTVVTECTDMLVSMFVILIFVFSRRGIISRLLSGEKMLALGNISLEFYLVHYLVIKYGIMAARHFGLDKGAAVMPLTLLFFALSLYGAFLIRSFTEWLLSAYRKKNTN